MSKAKVTYIIEGNEVLIRSVPKASRITIVVTTTTGEKGNVGLQFHNPKKGRKSFRLTKPKGQESKFVTALAENVFKPLLKGLITGEMNEASLKRLQKKTLNNTMNGLGHKKSQIVNQGTINCMVCGLQFASSQLISTHMKVHETLCKVCNMTI